MVLKNEIDDAASTVDLASIFFHQIMYIVSSFCTALFIKLNFMTNLKTIIDDIVAAANIK